MKKHKKDVSRMKWGLIFTLEKNFHELIFCSLFVILSLSFGNLNSFGTYVVQYSIYVSS
jgi:hypothetical protein